MKKNYQLYSVILPLKLQYRWECSSYNKNGLTSVVYISLSKLTPWTGFHDAPRLLIMAATKTMVSRNEIAIISLVWITIDLTKMILALL